jgi:hypothetical protein
MEFNGDSSTLDEGGGRNYNPTGSPYPYPGGTTNATTSDSYPPAIDGLVYISGNATMARQNRIGMLVVGGTIAVYTDMTMNYDPSILTNPPPGFCTLDGIIDQASWAQAVE